MSATYADPRRRSRPPSPAESRVLDALLVVTMDGWPATVREVGAAASLASPSTTFMHLEALEWMGLAKRNPRGKVGWFTAKAAA